MTVGSVVILLLAVALLVTAVLLVRTSSGLPWPAIVVAALTSAVCFTVGGGDSGKETSGPNIATVMGSVTGLLSVIAAVMALAPKRSHDNPASRTPIVLSAGGIALGALGLLLTLLTS